MANVISKAIIDTDLRAQTFAKLDLSEFSKVNDQTYGILLTDQNGVERYVRLRAVVAEVKDDMTAHEYMENEIAAYNEKMKMEVVGHPLEWKQAPDADVLAAARELGRLLSV